MDAQTAAAVSVYVDQYAAASEQMKTNTAAAVAVAWAAFDGWYSDSLVGEAAAQAAAASVAGQQAIAGLAEQYVAAVVAQLRNQPMTIAPTSLPPVRNGVDLAQVHARPAQVYRDKVAHGGEFEEAEHLAVQRRDGLAHTDLLLAEREAQQQQMSAQQVTRFRRVIRPELSQTGTCGLCIAASDRIYKTSDLLPIHAPTCKCKTMPIIGEDDPGRSLNADDLKQLYADAGSTKAEDLRRTRYEVSPHGELGPVLTKPEHKHRGPGDMGPPLHERAAAELKALRPVLEALQKRSAAGEDVTGPLAYQRERIAKLEQLLAA